MAFQKINDSDTLIDWKNKFNNNVDETVDLKNRLDVLEAGGTTDGELIALRSSTALNFTGTTADERVENAEQRILDNERRITALENKDLGILNVRDFGAVGDGVTDDAAAIQAALDAANAAGGAEVFIPDGVYAIKTSLRIYPYTRLRLAPRATIVRAGAFSPMLIPGIGDVDAYDGVHDIEIIGGTWDGNQEQFPAQFTNMSFMHVRNVLIKDARIINNYNSHYIEINAAQNVAILNCHFYGFAGVRLTEAIQLDLAKSSGQFPYYGNYDNTPCDGVLIQGCVFEDCNRGIGSHSATAGVYHKNVRIIGNHFRNLTGQGIRAYQWRWVTISGNTFENVRLGIEVRPGAGADASHIGQTVIANNVIKDVSDPSIGYGIWINGNGTDGANVYHVSITGNVIQNTSHTGIRADYMRRGIVSGNTVQDCGEHGIHLVESTYSSIIGNAVTNAQRHGIVLGSNSNVNVVSGNVCNANGRDTSVENANIAVVTGSNQNNIQGNTVRASGGLPTYGIWVTGTTSGNICAHNDARSGGATPLNLTGDTITLGGNVS